MEAEDQLHVLTVSPASLIAYFKVPEKHKVHELDGMSWWYYMQLQPGTVNTPLLSGAFSITASFHCILLNGAPDFVSI